MTIRSTRRDIRRERPDRPHQLDRPPGLWRRPPRPRLLRLFSWQAFTIQGWITSAAWWIGFRPLKFRFLPPVPQRRRLPKMSTQSAKSWDTSRKTRMTRWVIVEVSFLFRSYVFDVPVPTTWIIASFGCTGNAFGYSTLSNRGGGGGGPDEVTVETKNIEADALNPNLYCAIDEKDNRRLENMYEELQRRSTLQRKQKIDDSSATDGVQETLLPQEECGSSSYDQLDFARPRNELKPHYASTSTLRSQKSPNRSPKESTFNRAHKQRHSTGHLSQGEIPEVWNLALVYQVNYYY